jgi:hypothetical protein
LLALFFGSSFATHAARFLFIPNAEVVMICEYCQHDHGELHECDIDDLKENIDQLVGEAEDYVAIICSLKGAPDAVETTH